MRNMRMFVLGLGLFALTAAGAAFAQDQGTQSIDATGTAVSQRSSVEIPAGTEIAVRTNEAIDSKSTRAGQTYSAEVQKDVTGPSGEVVVPRGSTADLVVRQVSSGGTTGSPELALDLQSITIAGHRYEVSTANLQQSNKEGIGKNRRTGEMVGGGAALGTLIGAIAGGGKGAIIGAIAGAAAGGTAQVMTRGKEVKIPAETTLRFRLDQPLRLEPSGS